MSYTIAVSGINAVDNPGPGTGIGRSLKESALDVKIIGFAYDAMEPGVYMDWIIDKSYILPYPSGDVDSFINRILYIHEKEKLDIIIPCLDSEIPLYISIEEQLATAGIRMMLPSRKAFRDRNKDKLLEIVEHFGLKHPHSVKVQSIQEIDTAVEEVGFPCMVKGPFYEAIHVYDKENAKNAFSLLSTKWGYPIIIQKYINGEEYNIIGLADQGGDIGHVATKKMLVTQLGKIWTNISIDNKTISSSAIKFVEFLSWNGGYELELILDEKSNEYYLIEINPRFPAWVYMATGCGINLPQRLVQKLLQLPYETHSRYPAGKMLIRYPGEIIRSVSDFERLTALGES